MFRSKKTDRLIEIAESNNGFITTANVTSCSIQRRELTRAVKEGRLVKVERGLYRTPEAWEDEYVVTQHRFARGVFSHDTALYLLSLSDQAPEKLTLSFPQGYNTSVAKKSEIITKSSPEGLHELGITELGTPYGNKVRTYDAERTLCDMLRGTISPDTQRLNPAIRSYLTSSIRSLPKLLEYAEVLGVKNKIRKYLEVLL